MAKTKPLSLRFEKEDLKLGIQKSGFQKVQALMDFLLSEYVRSLKPQFSGEIVQKVPTLYKSTLSPEEIISKEKLPPNINLKLPDDLPKHKARTFQEILNAAKNGDDVRKEVQSTDSLTPGQKNMILSKIK